MSKDLEFELNGEMSEDEISELLDTMEKYTVKLPSNEEITLTIDALREYVPAKQSKKSTSPKIFGVISKAINEISFMSNNYWVASSGLFLAGFLVVLLNGGFVLNGNTPYKLAVLLSPIPFVLGIMEVFRGREEGMLELELSCKISISEILMSRLVIISIYNIVLNSILTGILICFDKGIVFWRITLMWLTPFTVVSALSLLIVLKIRGSYVVTVFTAAWMILIMSVLSQEKIMSKIMTINLAIYMVIAMLGMILLCIQIIKLGHRHSHFFEGSVLNEIKN